MKPVLLILAAALYLSASVQLPADESPETASARTLRARVAFAAPAPAGLPRKLRDRPTMSAASGLSEKGIVLRRSHAPHAGVRS